MSEDRRKEEFEQRIKERLKKITEDFFGNEANVQIFSLENSNQELIKKRNELIEMIKNKSEETKIPESEVNKDSELEDLLETLSIKSKSSTGNFNTFNSVMKAYKKGLITEEQADKEFRKFVYRTGLSFKEAEKIALKNDYVLTRGKWPVHQVAFILNGKNSGIGKAKSFEVVFDEEDSIKCQRVMVITDEDLKLQPYLLTNIDAVADDWIVLKKPY